MPVDFEEMQGSPTEQSTPQGFTAAMELMCAWGDRHTLLADFLASPVLYPHNTSFGAYAVSGSARPFAKSDDGGSGLITYDRAIVTINFSTASPDGREPGQTYSEDLEPYVENLPLPVRDASGIPLYGWTPTVGPPLVNYLLEEREAPARQMRGCYYTLTKYNEASIPAAAFSLIGKVNASSVVSFSLGVTFEAQTLLHTPPILNRTATTAGVSDWTLKYKWNYKPNFDGSGVAQGWNKFWRARTGQFESIHRLNADGSDAGVQLVYPTGNFALI